MSQQNKDKKKDRKFSIWLEVFSGVFACVLTYIFLTPESTPGGDTIVNGLNIYNIDSGLLSVFKWVGIGFIVLVVIRVLGFISDASDAFDIFDLF